MRRHPHLLEIHAFAFLSRVRARAGEGVKLSSVPREEWERFRNMGFDLIWLMGIWKRSRGAREAALGDRRLQKSFRESLPDWKDRDVVGSPYAVYAYEVDPYLGGEEDLAALRATLNELGLKLIVDFVPNHLALDHPWTRSHPSRFMDRRNGLREHRDWFFRTPTGSYLAHGRDPYFPPWKDTVQVDMFSEEARSALVGELLKIAEVSDGARCDMAMLLLNDVFRDTWGLGLDPAVPVKEFWEEAISQVKATYPRFLFIAEVYWDLEEKLQSLGFDYTYDKVLYDRLLRASAGNVIAHLKDKEKVLPRLVFFTENHDEERSVTAFGREKSLAAAAVVATLPGLRLFQEGQMEGKKTRSPIQLGRWRAERADEGVADYYEMLLSFVNAPIFHDGRWSMLSARPAWVENESYRHLLVWYWEKDPDWRLCVINFSHDASQGAIPVPGMMLQRPFLRLKDAVTNETYERDTRELSDVGLYLSLDPWRSHLFGPAEE